MTNRELSVFHVDASVISSATAQTNPQNQKTEQRATQPTENSPNMLHTPNSAAKQPRNKEKIMYVQGFIAGA